MWETLYAGELAARLAGLRAQQARPTHRLAATTTAARSLLTPGSGRIHHR
ncbi:hypothetical protein QLR68_25190 [Micromonospora sp. DH15]|nr:hypothetical protein [Micromonospora sp. DH15]